MTKAIITSTNSDERLFSLSSEFILKAMLKEQEKSINAVLKGVIESHYMMAKGMEEVRAMISCIPKGMKFSVFFESLLENTRQAIIDKDDIDAEYYELEGMLEAVKIMANVMIDVF